jgi:phosphoglycolate phosphatase
VVGLEQADLTMARAKLDVLFDLDGTLTDSRLGIVRCIGYALERLGRMVPEDDMLATFIGPPLAETFAVLLETAEETHVAEAISHYRERFGATGMFENALYPGVAECLAQLRSGGHRLWVATSKAHVYARPILAHFGIDDLFTGIYGSELNGENAEKRALIRTLLGREAIDSTRAVMIGDRRHDIDGALANGVSSIGALWGYGSREELQSAGAHRLAASIHEACEQVQDSTWTRPQFTQITQVTP